MRTAVDWYKLMHIGGFPLREWILAAAVLVLPTYALAQVQSGVQSGVKSGVLSGFDRYHGSDGTRRKHSRGPVAGYNSCWQVTTTRGIRRIWNCQPYGPP